MNCFLSFLLLTFLVSCHSTSQNTTEIRSDNTTVFSGQAMTVNFHIIIGSRLNETQIKDVTDLINTTFHEIDFTYNKWNPNSELSRLNDLKEGMEVPISASLENFLTETQRIVELSGGRFDPTIEPLQELWKKKLQKGNVPTDSELAEIASAIGWDKIHFSNGKFSKQHNLTKLDLGGIAKGLCVDLHVERLNGLGYPDVYVEWGGEIRTSGQHPDQRPWTIFISRLGNSDPSGAITLLTLENRAIATSGDYLQNWSVRIPKAEDQFQTVTYFHIFDPKTLSPLIASHTSVASASVAAPTCAFADGIATAAMMFPSINEAQVWAEEIRDQYPEITFWLISREQVGKL